MVDVDRFFRDKNLEELTRKTYDNMGLEVRDVLAKSDLYERDGKNRTDKMLKAQLEPVERIRQANPAGNHGIGKETVISFSSYYAA